jgi:hypothetical protein
MSSTCHSSSSTSSMLSGCDKTAVATGCVAELSFPGSGGAEPAAAPVVSLFLVLGTWNSVEDALTLVRLLCVLKTWGCLRLLQYRRFVLVLLKELTSLASMSKQFSDLLQLSSWIFSRYSRDVMLEYHYAGSLFMRTNTLCRIYYFTLMSNEIDPDCWR